MKKSSLALTFVLLSSLLSPANSETRIEDIGQVYGEKSFWWTEHYTKLMGFLGYEKSFAVVVGVGNFNDKSLTSLPSEKDAIRIKDYLVNEAGFDHVRLIIGDQVRLDSIKKLMIDYYPKVVGKKDRFLFYWSGHGVTTGEGGRKLGYLPVKSSSMESHSSMLSMRNLTEWDRRLNAKQTLYLLDACFTGIAASKAMSPMTEQTLERVSHRSRQVLTAGLEDQQTLAINDLDGGVFTHALLNGLRGEADTNKGKFLKDGVVTARELEEYIRVRVESERKRVKWPKKITPVLYNFTHFEGDFFFVWDKRIVKGKDVEMADTSSFPVGVVPSGVEISMTPKKNILGVDEIRKKRDIIHKFYTSGNYFSDIDKSISVLKNYAKNGNFIAYGYLGDMYYYYKKDPKTAIFWYEKGVEAGDPYASNSLGYHHEKGDLIEYDAEKSFKYYLIAAKSGLVGSTKHNVAQKYCYGYGVKKSISQCQKWLDACEVDKECRGNINDTMKQKFNLN